jgi:GNAT superfamily N-acetyltransferase
VTTTATTTDDRLGRALAFNRALYERACERREEHRWGVALFDARRPSFWTLNSLHADAPLDPGVRAEDVIDELGRVYPDHRHRTMMLCDDAAGGRLARGLLERGWHADHIVYMALEGARDRPPVPGLAREASEEELRAVERAVLAEDPGHDAAVIEQVLDARAAVRAATPVTRRFVGTLGGRDGATATLFSDGRVALVEDVATVTPMRGHGLARAAVSAAIDAAVAGGHELIVIGADDDDWPKQLYGRLGFVDLGRVWSFVRPRSGRWDYSASTRRPPA